MGRTEELVNLAKDLIDKAKAEGPNLRLLGGLAVYLNSPKGRTIETLKREYKDLDFVVNRKGVKGLSRIFNENGLMEDKQFNALHGATRLLYYKGNEFQIDVFIGVFEQCHKIDLEQRITMLPYTISLGDVFLTKIQIHKMNEKDVKDLLMFLIDHDFGLENKVELNELEYILSITSNDWGWYTTARDNLILLKDFSKDYLTGKDYDRVQAVIGYIINAMDNAPKTLSWKMRSIIGRKMPWYDEPEEVRLE
ncbi:hypothetical protein [Caldisericum exile]|uniref:Nucleotidyltransferase family protein n=1 Tax=Caldisericum exile (strain DSM 21853 / NBRC 104410 / AZM16c01) TaxID=511051 RepID=A0A7U6JH61_CALEA|nr:hypothetical protein [Caldisericum exile]BAL81502.1 hypothetical protein CSE_13760 [Caldisericum exile AZM16c01]